MPHETRLYETRVCCNVLLKFNTLEHHVINTYSPIPNSHSTHTATTYLRLNKKIKKNLLPHVTSLTSAYFAHLSISFNFLFFQLLSNFFFFLIGFQFCFLFFICILGRCGFLFLHLHIGKVWVSLFFFSLVRVAWDGR